MEKLKTIRIYIRRGGCQEKDLIDTRILESVTRNIEEIRLVGYESMIGLGKQFARILEEFKSLTSLELVSWNFECCVMKVISQKKTLRQLTLFACIFTADDLIISNFKNLESFEISWSRIKRPDELGICQSITTHLRNLKSLGLGLFEFGGYEKLFSLTKFKNLEEIDLTGVYNLDDYIMSKFKNLKKFACYGVKSITDDIVKSFIERNKNLEYLDVMATSVTSETLCFLYDWTKAKKHHAVLLLLISREVIEETQDYLKLNGDNPNLIIETFKPLITPNYKLPNFRKRSHSMVIFQSKENIIVPFTVQDLSSSLAW